jgi:pyruvate/2-oxoglutarate/acetoin dehydrogenase E1 component/TPP-dependent pyruvate/acetoin dehydrogenase alpha subunit
MTTMTGPFEKGTVNFSRDAVLNDFRIAWRSRHCSLIGRREVLTGKAKFGIFGDGKEVAQVAMAHAFELGDYRAGYYRDQTLMFALGELTLEQFFAQLYADADLEREPSSAGRSMTGHFASRWLDEQGRWLDQRERYNVSADLSPVAAQMPKVVGLGYASRLYRELPELGEVAAQGFSRDGNEVTFGTIGNAGCAEGMFWESLNAIGVLRAPVLLSIWDDGYGISVPNEYQMVKGDLAKLLAGFCQEEVGGQGIRLERVPGWDYPQLCEVYLALAQATRREHVPTVIHVREMTQPQGHSTSGSHERYKSPERLEFEERFDCLRKMREWIEREGFAGAEDLDQIVEEEEKAVLEAKNRAWEAFRAPIEKEKQELVGVARQAAEEARVKETVEPTLKALERRPVVLRRDLMAAAQEVLIATREGRGPAREQLEVWRRGNLEVNRERYGSHLHSRSSRSALEVSAVEAVYTDDSQKKNGFEILNACFDELLARRPEVIAFGEDVGQLGDVNQGMAGLQEKYGKLRVSDTGIREITILGQAIGMAQRGLRPIAEIQYLDYVLYALQLMSDELATLQWRTRGGQKAPVIVRTRGHRLEGIWHAGSPMAGVLNLCRGLWVCVPRNATQAAGFYNTLIESDDPGLIVEVLNAYRKKAPLPDNVGEFRVPLGIPEILREGTDVTVVTYGACCEIVLAAAERLAALGIEVEVVDVQTLLPFDVEDRIVRSLEKTNRLLLVDEDVPGGTTGYMLQQVLERQKGYYWLDAEPRTLSARPHRPAYGSDGDYFSKPNREEIVETVYSLMREADPRRFPELFD